MKKKFSVLALALCAIGGTAWGQVYQLPNSDFEADFVYGYKSTAKEAPNWHGFPTMDGSGANPTVGRKCGDKMVQSTDVRPGSSGSKSVYIKATKVGVSFITKLANGVLTSGRVYSGSTTPTDASKNYNYSPGGTYTDNSNQNTNFTPTFNGKPDMMRVWVKFDAQTATQNATYKYASVKAVLHNNNRYQDPEATDYSKVKIAEASDLEIGKNGYGEWQKLEIPFTYHDNLTDDTPAYMYVGFSTNTQPGAGTDGDILYIDDLEFVYYNTLSSLAFDGKAVDGFAENTLAYTIKGAEAAKDKIAATAKSQFASVETTVESAHKATVKVTANDKSTTTYTLTFIPYEYTLVDGKLTVTGTVYDEDVTTLAAVVKDNNVSSVDLKSATIKASDISALTGALKSNVPVYVPSGCTAKGTDNAVKGTTASNYILTDASGDAHPSLSIPEDFVAEKITYSREFTIGNNYVSTFILPFGFTVPQDVTIAQLNRVDNGMLYFTEVSETEANKPYVVITDTKNFVNDLANVQVKKTVGADLTTQVDGVKHIGSYTEQTVSGVYGYANGKFVKATSGTVYPFRTYIQLTEGAAAPKAFGLAIENPTTGITRVVSQSTDAEAPVYNLQGIRQNSTNLPKGVYIVNGKKIIK